MDITIILNEPKYEGNIGFIARTMKNFNFEKLILVNGPELNEKARSRASHAQEVLESAKRIDNINKILDDFDLRVATTGIRGESENNFKRNPVISPKELKNKLNNKKGTCGIFFGREDHGLSNEIIKKCELVLSINTNPSYPILNLSHAVSIILYELNNINNGEYTLAEREELKAVFDRINELIDSIDYPDYKLGKTKLMVKRILGRATLSSREAHTLAGFFNRIKNQLSEEK